MELCRQDAFFLGRVVIEKRCCCVAFLEHEKAVEEN